MKNLSLISLVIFSFLISCVEKSEKNVFSNEKIDWKPIFNDQVNLLGHRNWILIVDKAFPLQNSTGIITLNTNEDLLSVLKYTLQQIKISSHIYPIVYIDKELNYITTEQIPEIEKYKEELFSIVNSKETNVCLHDSVFVKIDRASRLFNVLVLKTNQSIPYSSVFLQLDCKYWSKENENQLRELMQKNSM